MERNLHYESERKKRREFIENTIGYGNSIATVFYTSKTSRKERINVLSDTGVITVYTKEWKIVTVLIASYSQACILYKEATKKEPSFHLKEAFRTAQQYKEYEPA